MAPDINPSLPVVGQPNSSEEVKIPTALSQLVAAVNDVDSAQIKDGSRPPTSRRSRRGRRSRSARPTFLAPLRRSTTRTRWGWSTSPLRRGHSPTGATSDGTTLGTMPAGYRPGSTQYFPLQPAHGDLFGGLTLSIIAAGVVALVQNQGGGPNQTYSPFVHWE
jgi:hypothetical protein